MKPKRSKLQIDAKHSRQLVTGKPIAIVVPKGAEVIEIQLDRGVLAQRRESTFAEVCDVFFNGRAAQA
jgi:hypothetical protein